MAAQTKDSAMKATVKRKRQDVGDGAKKRRKSDGGGENESQPNIKRLEAEILESRKHFNNIVVLLGIAQDTANNTETTLLAVEAVCRVFIQLLALGNLVKKQDASEKDATVTKWLRERLSEYETALISLLHLDTSAMKAVTLAMALLKAEAQHLDGREVGFPRRFFHEIVAAVLQSPVEQLRNEFSKNFVNAYDDIRFYTFEGIAYVSASKHLRMVLMSSRVFVEEWDHPEDERVRGNIFNMLLDIKDVPGSSEKLEDFYIDPPKQKKKNPLLSWSQHQKRAQEAWLAVMNLGLNKDQRKKVLEIMATSIAPWFSKPELLMDFLTDCYNSGGSISLLALSGVFYLIQERNLDYPSFYTKLYSLLDADVLHSKYRSRFFRLLDTFLGSSHLPAVLVASFIKRLARLALNAPPSAIVAIVPWFYNIFKKHPLCTFMMHRVPRTKEERDLLESEGLADPFLPDEEDPMETRAIDSCIWEIVQLQSHYHPNVATIAKIVSEQFTKQSYSIEDFLDHSYSSVRAGCSHTPEWLTDMHRSFSKRKCSRRSRNPQSWNS